MLRMAYKNIAVGILLVTLVVYWFSQFPDDNDNRQFFFPPAAISIVELNRYIKGHPRKDVVRYINNFLPIQIQDVIRQLRVSDLTSSLTSEVAQKQFLQCSGMKLLQQLPVRIPQSHQHCKKMSFQSSGPVIALGSFPGSGNSWVRQLLESATGIYTGTPYCDGAYVQAGMMGEGVATENVIAIKTHERPAKAKQLINHDKAIYLVRSPFATILAEHNWSLNKKADRHTVETVKSYRGYANDTKWEKLVKQRSSVWKQTVSHWVNVKQYPVLIVGYENLMSNTYAELKRILDFIGYPYSENDILCTVKSSGEGFHRKHTKKHYNPFSPKLQEFVLDKIKEIDASLLKHNISLHYPYTI